MTEYVLLIKGDADRWWTTMTAEQRAAGYAEYGRFSAELERRGHKIRGGAELHASTEAKHLAPGSSLVSDGPFAEAAEQVGGFYLIESDDLDDLMQCATIIAALGDGIEVRRTVQPEERTP